MSTKGQDSISKPAPPPPPPKSESPAKEKEFVKKWGADAHSLGWTAIPNILLERQQALGLESVDLNLILILLKHWWKASDDAPFPTKKTLADIIGRTEKTVQARIAAMEKKGLITRNERYSPVYGRMANGYDLSGLITKLKALAKAEVKERKKKEQEAGKKRRGHVKTDEEAQTN